MNIISMCCEHYKVVHMGKMPVQRLANTKHALSTDLARKVFSFARGV